MISSVLYWPHSGKQNISHAPLLLWNILQEFGLTPVMWQIVDLARWLDPRIHILTVVHSPRATPNLEERGVVRALSEMSDSLIVMTWYIHRLPTTVWLTCVVHTARCYAVH